MSEQPHATLTTVSTPRGATLALWCRDGTIDLPLAMGVLSEDEYHVREHALGWQAYSGHMLDVGGYIGFVGLAWALENPALRVTIVEPILDNVAMIRRNIVANALEARVSVLNLAAGTDADATVLFDYQHVEGEPDGYVQDSRFVGNLYAAGSHPMEVGSCIVPGASLATLLERIGLGPDERLSVLKLDCEGCEWQLLRSPEVARVDTIFGEWHGDYVSPDGTRSSGLDGLAHLLPDHYVRQVDDNPVNGIFWAYPRG